METGVSSARALLAKNPAQLFGRTPCRRKGTDRLRSKMGQNVQRSAEGSVKIGRRGSRPGEFQEYYARHLRYTAGTETRYAPSIISAKPIHQRLAKGLVIGMRFHSAAVIRLADAKPVQLGHTIKADGRWRLFVFAPAEDPVAPASSFTALCQFLAGSRQSPVRRYTPKGADIDAVIDVRAIFQQGHRELAIE